MFPFLAHRDAIEELCRLYAVRRLDAFGSATRADFDPSRSDIDLVVEFSATAPGTAGHYFDFKTALESLLGRPVDLVELPAVRGARLRGLIDRSRVPVYGTAG